MMIVLQFSVYILGLVLGASGADTNDTCKSPQYLELRTKGTISCSFQGEFYAVLWYNSTNYVTESPLVYLQQSIKEGYGYDSGDFDIFPNGSLIIQNVSSMQDHYFTAVKLTTLSDELLPHYIRVITVVKPKYQYPVISQCEKRGDLCFVRLLHGSNIECTLSDTWPEFALSWVARTAAGDRNISFEMSLTKNNSLYTSTIITEELFSSSNLLSLLVCKVDSPKGILNNDESHVIVQNGAKSLVSLKPMQKQFHLNSQLVLPCVPNANFFVWKYKDRNSDQFEHVLHGLYSEGNVQKYARNSYALVNKNFSLAISNVTFQHEGQYGCIYGNGTHDGMVLYDATIYAIGEIFVKGCLGKHYCTLEVPWQGILTCEVKGIRPSGQLIWSVVKDDLQTDILFYDHQTTITHNIDDTFDLSLTARYEARTLVQHRQAVECKVVEIDIKMLHLTAKVELLFVTGESTPQSGEVSEEMRSRPKMMHWVIIAVVLVVLLSLLSCTVAIIKATYFKRRQLNTNKKPECEIPMIPTQRPDLSSSGQIHFAKKEIFIEELKTKYKKQCGSIHPLPFIREKMYSLEQVFVEGQLMFLCGSGKHVNSEQWQILDSYQDIFNVPSLKSTRRILEGEPGIGKSTLTLQFAYDWINGVKGSYMKNVDILVLLRLRQMGNIRSIFKAIKQFLLPIDTKLTENDIECMIQNTKSVVVIFDGFDEYPHQSTDDCSDVISIINGDMLLQAEIILTTRSSCLPKGNALVASKRIKVAGFEEEAREKYLQKAIIGSDFEAAERIRKKLGENPFLDDLCQNPLFFVMFAHMTQEQANVFTVNSVTQFFHCIMSCLHSHMKNKMNVSDLPKFEFRQHEHAKLDKEAFKALFGKSQNIAWNKETLVKQIGCDFYDQYVKTGILVEEEVCYLKENPGTGEDIVEFVTEVTFYHKLFCEWFAAHFLANYAVKPDVSLDEVHDFDSLWEVSKNDEWSKNSATTVSYETYSLSNIDPFDLQYVYRFACGLNSEAAEKIYQYLKKKHGGDKFSLLCIIEQSNRFNTIKEHLVQLCSRTVDIHETQSKLLQRSIIQLLEIASRQHIEISNLMLINCFQLVEMSGTYVLLKSGIKIPVLTTLTRLLISDEEREINEKQAIAIIRFCARCPELINLKFECCLLPQYIDIKSNSVHIPRRFTVLWESILSCEYRLCLQTGHWENKEGSGTITNSEYLQEMEAFNKSRM